MKTMNPYHPLWNDFLFRLQSDEEGISLAEDIKGKMVWKCDGTEDRPKAKAILESMPGIDVERSFKYFEERGGFCDCEIIWNVESHAHN